MCSSLLLVAATVSDNDLISERGEMKGGGEDKRKMESMGDVCVRVCGCMNVCEILVRRKKGKKESGS